MTRSDRLEQYLNDLSISPTTWYTARQEITGRKQLQTSGVAVMDDVLQWTSHIGNTPGSVLLLQLVVQWQRRQAVSCRSMIIGFSGRCRRCCRKCVVTHDHDCTGDK